jgi:hypothetical protein
MAPVRYLYDGVSLIHSVHCIQKEEWLDDIRVQIQMEQKEELDPAEVVGSLENYIHYSSRATDSPFSSEADMIVIIHSLASAGTRHIS